MKKSILLSIFIAAIIITGCSREKTPEEIVRAYIEAQNSHDIDERMKYFDEETAFVMPGSDMRLRGEDEIRGMSQYDSVLQTTLIVEELTVEGNTVICEITEENRWLEAAGLEPIHYDSTLFYIIDDKIRKIVSFPADSSIARMMDVLNKFMPWLAENYPYETMDMMPGGQFEYSPENAERIIELLSEWRLTTEESP